MIIGTWTAPKPVISGTGSEDYFCGAWDFGRAFWDPYFGVPYYDNASKGGEKRGILNTCYRWHIQDPVPFKKASSSHWSTGAAAGDEDRKPFTNHYTTVGFYYLDNPEGDGPPLPAFKDRVPALIPASPRLNVKAAFCGIPIDGFDQS
jgi:hypothetical protein